MKETSHRRALTSTALDIDGIVHFLSIYFKVSKEKVKSTSPYKRYAIYLTRKHTPFSNTEIGKYFGGITYSAVTKVGTRFKERMREDKRLRDEMSSLENALSRVKGCPLYFFYEAFTKCSFLGRTGN